MPDELETTTGSEADDAAAADTGAPGSQGETTADDAPLSERFKDFLTKSAEEGEAKEDDKPTDETTDEKPEPKADEKPEAKAKDEKGPDELDEDEDQDELELLKPEDIDKRFPNSPKGLRGYAKAISAKFAPYVDAVEELGGLEAVKRLDSLSVIATGEPELKEDGNVDKFIDSLNSTNPSFSEALQTKLFYGAIDENPALLDTLIKANLGENWTGEKLQNLVKLVEDGEIDLEDIQDKLDAQLSPAEKQKRETEAIEKTREAEEKADLLKRVEVVEGKETQAAREKDVVGLWGQFAKVVEPVQKKFGLQNFISKDDPEDIKAIKTAYMDDLGNAIGRRLEQNQLFQTLAKKIDSQQKGDDYAWLSLKCANIYKGIYREEAAKRAPMLAAYLKEYGGPVKAATTRRPEPDKDATHATEPSPKAKDESDDTRVLSEEDRRDRGREEFRRLLEEKEAESGKRRASAA
jgi:hypothetical protein